ncbi:hypothetical protein IF2G_08452 [Cordyceps javanica]|nr:hypothetical protein IF2G_08452 [Cordyceps javanica]
MQDETRPISKENMSSCTFQQSREPTYHCITAPCTVTALPEPRKSTWSGVGSLPIAVTSWPNSYFISFVSIYAANASPCLGRANFVQATTPPDLTTPQKHAIHNLKENVSWQFKTVPAASMRSRLYLQKLILPLLATAIKWGEIGGWPEKWACCARGQELHGSWLCGCAAPKHVGPDGYSSRKSGTLMSVSSEKSSPDIRMEECVIFLDNLNPGPIPCTIDIALRPARYDIRFVNYWTNIPWIYRQSP